MSNLLEMLFHLNSSEHFQFCVRLEMLNKHELQDSLSFWFTLQQLWTMSSNFSFSFKVFQIFRAQMFHSQNKVWLFSVYCVLGMRIKMWNLLVWPFQFQIIFVSSKNKECLCKLHTFAIFLSCLLVSKRLFNFQGFAFVQDDSGLSFVTLRYSLCANVFGVFCSQ